MALSELPHEIILPILDYLDTDSLWQLGFVSTTFNQHCLVEIQERWYRKRMTIFVGLPKIQWLISQRKRIWRSICCAALACLTTKEWELGALRLFYLDHTKLKALDKQENFKAFNEPWSSSFLPHIAQKQGQSRERKNHSASDSSFSKLPPLIPFTFPPDHSARSESEEDKRYPFPTTLPLHFSFFHTTSISTTEEETTNFTSSSIDGFNLLSKLQSTYPNPAHPEWKSALTCTLDFHESFLSLSSSIGSCDLMLRYSERMDIGSFLLWIPSPSGCLLLRLKPTGVATKETPWGSTGLVLWDSSTFGYCNFCNVKLERLQVCGACRVFQYCSRDCQKLDWEKGHPHVCKQVKFTPYFKPVSASDDEDDQQTDLNV